MTNIFIRYLIFVCAVLSTLTYAQSADMWVDSYTPAVIMEIKSAVADESTTLYYSKKIPVITLEPLSDSQEVLETRSHRVQSSTALGNPLQAGFKRSTPSVETIEKFSSYLDWEMFADGRHLAALSVVLPQAVGSRFVLNIEQLHPRAQLRFSSSVSDEVVIVSGEDVISSIFANKRKIIYKNIYIVWFKLNFSSYKAT